jgi:hypothetical protein
MRSSTLPDRLKTYGPAVVSGDPVKKKTGLVDLERHTGLSAPQYFRRSIDGNCFRRAALLRIALVFSVGLDDFFSGNRQKSTVGIVLRTDRLRFPKGARPRDIAYQFG